MIDIGFYLLKSTVVSALFYLVYLLTLKRESFLNTSRFYLLGSLLFAYLFPFIKFSISQETEEALSFIPVWQATVNRFPFTEEIPVVIQQEVQPVSNIDFWPWLLLGCMSSILLFRFINHLLYLIKTVYSNETLKRRTFTLVFQSQKNTFSFFRYIFISPFVWRSPEGQDILSHERSHIRHKHTYDRLFLELMTIVFWMNPFIYLYRKELEEVHEFQADRDATRQSANRASYFNLVLQQASGHSCSPLMSPFSYKLIKKRIIMSTHKSNPLKKLMIALPVLLAVGILTISGITNDLNQDSSVSQKQPTATWPTTEAMTGTTEFWLFDPGVEPSETDASVKEGKIHTILINSKGLLLMEGQKTEMEDVKPAIIQFLTKQSNGFPEYKTKDIPLLGTQLVNCGIISLQRDQFTPDDAANKLLQLTLDAYEDVRNKAALTLFSKNLEDCDDAQKETIRQLHPQRIHLLTPRKKGMKIDTSGSSLSWISPINNNQLLRKASGWGWRIHPIYKVKKFHLGVDMCAKINTPVHACLPGTVTLISEEKRGYGKRIEITHNNGYKTLYAHLNGFNVKTGQPVTQGEVIGFVGLTGTASSAHLHFEVHLNDKSINPMQVLPQNLALKESSNLIWDEKKLFSLPITKDSLRKTSGYGKRLHPITQKEQFHHAIDYAASLNTRVMAIGNGIVRKVNTEFIEGKGYGRYIIIDHDNGYSSLYAQLNEYNVKEGQKVKAGDAIGFVGQSGQSTGPHLHLEIKKDGQYINPDKLIDVDSNNSPLVL